MRYPINSPTSVTLKVCSRLSIRLPESSPRLQRPCCVDCINGTRWASVDANIWRAPARPIKSVLMVKSVSLPLRSRRFHLFIFVSLSVRFPLPAFILYFCRPSWLACLPFHHIIISYGFADSYVASSPHRRGACCQ